MPKANFTVRPHPYSLLNQNNASMHVDISSYDSFSFP